MKQRLVAYVLACFLVGLIASTLTSFIPDHRLSPIHIRVYPNVDVDQAIAQINDLHLSGITAVRLETSQGWMWFCFQTLWTTFLAIIGTAFVLLAYTALCRAFKISLKK